MFFWTATNREIWTVGDGQCVWRWTQNVEPSGLTRGPRWTETMGDNVGEVGGLTWAGSGPPRGRRLGEGSGLTWTADMGPSGLAWWAQLDAGSGVTWTDIMGGAGRPIEPEMGAHLIAGGQPREAHRGRPIIGGPTRGDIGRPPNRNVGKDGRA